MKKVLSAIVTLSLCLTLVTPVFANAATNETPQQQSRNVLSLKKQNYNYLEGKPGDTHLVYTYDSNGSTYKVVENASEDFGKVDSTIYVKDKKGVFVKYATQNVTVNNSTFTQTTNVNGKVTVETLDLSLQKSAALNEQSVSPLNNHGLTATNTQGSGSYCTLGQCYAVTGWQFVAGSQQFEFNC
jgi:hypothetical protein